MKLAKTENITSSTLKTSFLALALVLLLGTVVTISSLAFVFAPTSISLDNPETKVARASGIEDMVTDELIAFYEKEIAKDTFISSMTTMKKDRLMSAYDINEKRLYLTLILQDLGARVDDHKDFNQIAQMNDKQLFSYGKTLVLSYIDTLTEEEKARLKDGFKSALGM
ncbi:MAG: hypothetical protein IJY49_06130 [Clostridia bacterium]|nr:hypothetical protein [Clostridia bacterium]